MPASPAADPDVRQQVRPSGARSPGVDGRSRARARHRRRPGQLAHWQRRAASGRVRHPRPDSPAIRTRGAGTVSGAGRHVVARRSARAGDDRGNRVRAFPRVAGRDPCRRHAIRRGGVSRGTADAGLLRQRLDQLRARAVPPGAGRARAAAAAASERFGNGGAD